MNCKVLTIALSLFVSACGSSKIEVTSAPLKIDIQSPEMPVTVQMLPVKFRVLNKDNIAQYLTELGASQNSSPVFIGFTVADYENLALNIADIKRYIEQQQAIINYYKTVTNNK